MIESNSLEVDVLRLAFLLLLLVQEVNPEALEYLRQAEALIDTDRAYSLEQAELFEKALALEPGLAAPRYNVAIVYLKLATYDKAEAHLTRLLEIEPDHIRGRLARAELYLQTGRPGLAVPDVRIVLEREPLETEAWRTLGRAQFEMLAFEEALTSFTQVRELAPEDRDVELDLGLVKHNLDQPLAAAEHFLRFLESRPGNVDVILLTARSLRDGGRLESSLEHYLNAEKLRPDDSDLRREIAYLYLELDQLGEADRRLQDGNGGSNDFLNRALIALRENRLLDAELAIRRALTLEPENAAFWAELGHILFLAEQQEQAANAFQRALDLGARTVEVYRSLGAIRANLQQPETARELLEAGLALEPDDAALHFQLAVVLERLEQPQPARRHFQQALALGKDEPRIHFRLAALQARDGAAAEALGHLETALQAEPAKYLPLLEQEILKVRSDFDSIRYRLEFSQLMEAARARLKNEPRQPEPN